MAYLVTGSPHDGSVLTGTFCWFMAQAPSPLKFNPAMTSI
jgi:hypothetical protein